MDGSDKKAYRRIVTEAAKGLIEGVDCAKSQPSVAAQLQTGVIRVEVSQRLLDHELCELILRASDSPVAQSFRNTRLTNSGARLNYHRWAGLALSSDVRETVLKWLQGRSFNHPELRTCVLAWQRQDSLRGDFADDTPWCVIADWYNDLGDSLHANLCREFESAGESKTTEA